MQGEFILGNLEVFLEGLVMVGLVLLGDEFELPVFDLIEFGVEVEVEALNLLFIAGVLVGEFGILSLKIFQTSPTIF